jgi:hypothetical protein
MRGMSRMPPMSWRRNPPMRGVSRRPPMSWRRKLPMEKIKMKSPPPENKEPRDETNSLQKGREH